MTKTSAEVLSMAGITLTQAENRLADYLAAEEAVLAGQAYSLAGRSITKADLQWIQKGLEIWNQRCKTLSRGGSVIRKITPTE